MQRKIYYPKRTNLYGVEVSPLEEMKIMKLINEQSKAPNTLTSNQRKELVREMLTKI